MSEFFSIVTNLGLQKLAALPTGETLTLTHMAFGNSTLEPTADMTALHSEQYRCELTKVQVDKMDKNNLVTEATIEADVGGFWIREIGIYDEFGDLFAVGKYPATYKPSDTEGTVKELGVRMILRVTNADTVMVTYYRGIIDGAANTDLDNLTFAGQQKFDDKADLESPTFTGTPMAPTPAQGNNTTQVATTAFVATAVAAAIEALMGAAPDALNTLQELATALGNDENFATTVTNEIAKKANIASPTFTGTPKAPTAAAGTNTTQIATTAFVTAAVSVVSQAITTAVNNLVGSAPDGLNTLQELAAAIGNDTAYSTTVTNALANKANKTGDTVTGANATPTSAFTTRNIKAQTTDPGAGSSLTTGQILLVYE